MGVGGSDLSYSVPVKEGRLKRSDKKGPLPSAKKTAVKDGSCSSVVGRVGERFGGGGGRGADGESK